MERIHLQITNEELPDEHREQSFPASRTDRIQTQSRIATGEGREILTHGDERPDTVATLTVRTCGAGKTAIADLPRLLEETRLIKRARYPMLRAMRAVGQRERRRHRRRWHRP